MTARRLGSTIFALCVAGAGGAAAADLQTGLDAWRANHIAQAETAFAQVAGDANASVDDRGEAARALGQIDWLARGETDAIATALAQTSDPAQRCATAATALRVFREAGAPRTPLADAEAAQAHCTLGGDNQMHIELARTHLALALSEPGQARAHLAAAATELAAVNPATRPDPEVAGPMLSLALAQRDGAAALAAWRNYYWLTDADAPQAMGAYAGRAGAIFNAGLAANASDADLIALVEMLVRAGFVEDARLIAAQTNLGARAAGNAAWTKLAAFLSFDSAVRASTLRANREMIAGGHAAWYQDEIRTEMGQLMQAAGLSGDPRPALGAAYGIYGSLGETSGYASLHGGHFAEDEHISVNQYGHHSELRFIVIDNMISNGYESWLWDGWAEAGGWSGDDGIVQVRSAYTGGPVGALRRARPGPIRDRFTAGIERARAGELAALGRDGVASLPSTGDELELQAIDQIAARTGADDAAFIAEMWRATNQYSIELHEGRHAIDHTLGHFSDTVLEYNAKLSQIALSDYPRLGLSNVVSSTLANTPHGNANRRLMQGYRSWMRAHAREIPGFDTAKPTLTQLTLLSDDQIRAIARGLDPLARGAR